MSEVIIGTVKGDVVDISVPNNLLLPLATQVLGHSGNLLVEKPLCSSLEEALRFKDYISRLNLNDRVLTDAEHYSHYENIKLFYNFIIFYFYKIYLINFPRIHVVCPASGPKLPRNIS